MGRGATGFWHALAMSDRVSITVDNGIADVRLNRPDKLNALDQAMFQGIVDAGEGLKGDPAVRVVVLSGEGRGFCAGLDFGSFQAMAGSGAGAQRPSEPRRRRRARARSATPADASPTSASRRPGCGRSSRCR